jgi:hypothetical protein
VVAIIGLLTLIAYPSRSSLAPKQKVRGESDRLSGLFQKVRQRAQSSQRPIRVSLSCRNQSARGCRVSVQAAVFSGTTIADWAQTDEPGYTIDPAVQVSHLAETRSSDGLIVNPDIFWAIFMPDSRVYSDPRPFDLYLYHPSGDKAPTGFRLQVSNDTGRPDLTKAAVPLDDSGTRRRRWNR